MHLSDIIDFCLTQNITSIFIYLKIIKKQPRPFSKNNN